jgi:cell shape-determining protein MreD
MVFYIFLILAILFESSVTSIPVILATVLAYAVVRKSYYIFLVAFIAGIIFDLLVLRQIGQTSLFLTCLLTVIFLYQRKFEINSIYFVVFVSSISAYIYTKIFVIQNSIIHSLATIVISSVLFVLFRAIVKIPQE